MSNEELIQLWLDAEEEKRKHSERGDMNCHEMKQKFIGEYNKLSEKDKDFICDYLDSVGA